MRGGKRHARRGEDGIRDSIVLIVRLQFPRLRVPDKDVRKPVRLGIFLNSALLFPQPYLNISDGNIVIRPACDRQESTIR